ncbi:MAG: InlB B-repeat-containing protein [Clostridia bacterium]|nr:InlB B-repeat-containing protein [Clostridia bacterium]
MRKTTKIFALILLVSTLIAVFTIGVSAAVASYPMSCTIYYKDESGNTLSPAYSFTVNASEQAQWGNGRTSPTISGYSLKNSSDSYVSYEMMDKYFPASHYIRNGTATYTVIYVKDSTHTVYYIYGENYHTASPSVSKTGKPGTSYSFTSPTITGYGPTQATVSGTFGTTNTSTTVYYYRQTYTVSYNASGGSGAPSSQTKTYGVDLTLSSTTPTKSGYTFKGWATSPGSSSVAYSPGGTYIGNSNMNLYAVWTQNVVEPTTYTISYNANGGTGAPASQTKTKDVSLTLSSVLPIRDGYVCKGWSASSTATNATYQPGGTYTANSSVTLYAVWKSNSTESYTPTTTTYTVTYNANGGTGAPASQTKIKGVDLQLSSIAPTRNGYTFEGWSNSSSSSHIFCTPGEYYDADADLDLYAVWTLTPTYTISFDANGGVGAPSSQIKTHGVALTLSSTVPTRSGYAFLGWSTSPIAISATYSAGGKYTSNSNATLYAVWQTDSSATSTTTCTVTYNANGGTGAPASQSVASGSKLTLSSTIPVRSGYTFKGWATKSWATSATYQPETTWTITTNMTLYAVWQGGGTYFYTVTFDANGGSGAPDPITANYGETIEIPSTEPIKRGYNFISWIDQSSGEYYNPGDLMTVYADVSFSALWYVSKFDDDPTEPLTYIISYNANGGSGAPASQTKIEGVDLQLSSVAPTRSGYAFAGWSLSSSSAHIYYTPGEYYIEDADLSLFAVWESTTPTYTVRYNANGGSGAPLTQIKTKGIELKLSTTVPTKSGYRFEGWTTKSGSSVVEYSPGEYYSKDENLYLYAVWESTTPTYIISYNANGGTGAPSSQAKTHGVTLMLSSIKPTRTGYDFLGWATSSSATSATYSAGGSYTANASATLYAVWSANTYTISYNANGGSGAPPSQTKIYGVALTLSSANPIRTGYTFLGWSTSSTATSATYSAGGSYTANASATLYAVWSTNTYIVSYNANGGSNAPAAQSKIHGTPITLSTSEPTRNGYLFLGWSMNSTATDPTYLKGATYSDNASVTLYAVWDKINYDFTVSNLIVSPSEVNQYETINIRFRLDLNDKSQARNGVPVAVYFGGELVYSSSLNFTANGVNYVNFDLNVGNALGDKTVEARINWADHLNETNTADNSVTATVNVKFYSEMAASIVSVGGKYIEGTEVMTSFFAENGSSLDILPDNNVKFDFEVYELNGSSETLVISKTKSNIVIPANGSNLVYFKWTIPIGSAGKTYVVKGTVNGDNKDFEDNAYNNSAFFTLTVSDNEYSQTSDTRYERNAPSSYIPNAIPPATSTGVATWNEWEYDAATSSLVLRQYGASISNAPTITPDTECKTATKAGGVWTMKSGYGITVLWSPTIDTLSGYLTPRSDSVTKAQTAFALFPEFAYSAVSGYYRTLDAADGTFEFIENPDAVNNARVHFIPIYVKNGEYVVSCTASQIWTPAGMITVTQNANTVRIDGTIYDDWAKE